MTLLKEKHQFGSEVKFAGYILNAEGTKPDPDKVAAIGKFPEPTNLTDLRSFMGLVNQFADFAPDLKHTMQPLKGLLSKKNAFVWTDDHGAAMIKVKEIITDPNGPVLRHFDPKLPIKLLTDASRTGIGYILTQEDQDKAQRMITCDHDSSTTQKRMTPWLSLSYLLSNGPFRSAVCTSPDQISMSLPITNHSLGS